MRNPLRPEEAAAHKLTTLPDGVIEVFDDLIAEHYNGHYATFAQAVVVQRLLQAGVAGSSEEVFARHMLDVEPVYQQAGWEVRYEKPGFNEPGDAYFTFVAPAAR